MDTDNESFQKPLLLLRLIFVYVFLILLLALNASNASFLDFGTISPFFLLMGIYYWTLMRPALLPLPLVFILGLLLDFATGVPVGLNAFSFLLLVFILNSQRRFLIGQSWTMLWVGFTLACFMVLLVHFVIFSIFYGSLPGFAPLFISMAVSALIYPLVTVPMTLLTRFLK